MKWEKHLSLNAIRSSESPLNFRNWSKLPMAVHNHISSFANHYRIYNKRNESGTD